MTCDAIIIRGGHKGLVFAQYQAKSGKQMLVLERPGFDGGEVTGSPGQNEARAILANQ